MCVFLGLPTRLWRIPGPAMKNRAESVKSGEGDRLFPPPSVPRSPGITEILDQSASRSDSDFNYNSCNSVVLILPDFLWLPYNFPSLYSKTPARILSTRSKNNDTNPSEIRNRL